MKYLFITLSLFFVISVLAQNKSRKGYLIQYRYSTREYDTLASYPYHAHLSEFTQGEIDNLIQQADYKSSYGATADSDSIWHLLTRSC